MNFKTSQELFNAGYGLMVYAPNCCAIQRPNGEVVRMKMAFYQLTEKAGLDGIAVRVVKESELPLFRKHWELRD